MVEEFYGCLSREMIESCESQRVGLEFEVVKADQLNFFLGKGNGERIVSEKHEAVFSMFQEYGLLHERFREVKGRYLGETGFKVLTVYFDGLDFAKYRCGNWYGIRFSQDSSKLGREALACSICDWGDEDNAEINSYCSIDTLPDEQAAMLRELYHPYIPEESSIRKTGKVGAITEGTVFRWVRFYYVGAALCVLLLDDRPRVTAFFDLGVKVSKEPALSARFPSAENARGRILACLSDISDVNKATIFISHWHNDHTNAIGKCYRFNRGLNNMVDNTEWYVPASGLPSFTTVQNVMPAELFHVCQEGMEQDPMDIDNNPRMQIGKINLQNNPHPHHQGIYAKVTLRSGKQVLLVGDTTYEGLPEEIRSNGGRGYDCLQVCHHGGDYYLPPANQNIQTAASYIPKAKSGAIAVYSADGRTYGHPDPFFVAHYRGQGYTEDNEWMIHTKAVNGICMWDIE
jgi:hypothetical protein